MPTGGEMQASKNTMQDSSPAPHSATHWQPSPAALLLAVALACLPHSVRAFNFDDLEKVEKAERSERKVREVNAEATRRQQSNTTNASQGKGGVKELSALSAGNFDLKCKNGDSYLIYYDSSATSANRYSAHIDGQYKGIYGSTANSVANQVCR
jgi:hypothetical protein